MGISNTSSDGWQDGTSWKPHVSWCHREQESHVAWGNVCFTEPRSFRCRPVLCVDVGMWEAGWAVGWGGTLQIDFLRDRFSQPSDSEQSVLALGFQGIFSCHSDHQNHFETYPSKLWATGLIQFLYFLCWGRCLKHTRRPVKTYWMKKWVNVCCQQWLRIRYNVWRAWPYTAEDPFVYHLCFTYQGK